MHDMEALKGRFDGAKTALAQRRRRNERVCKHLTQITAALDRLPAAAPAGLDDLRAEIGRLAVENRRLRGLMAERSKAEPEAKPEPRHQASKSDMARLLGGADDDDETDPDANLRPPATRILDLAAAEPQGNGSAASKIVQGLIRELNEDPG